MCVVYFIFFILPHEKTFDYSGGLPGFGGAGQILIGKIESGLADT
ncbi:MAG: hypothetical protein Q8M09_18315 [Pseudomonadota bacterium]|nr:hypothetical protein [Pseudomonadota bacterium]MDP1906170.1 hypothetical protein [Pseudomonadota bacterium]